jgi:predicted ArsR family transcriptional regulator
LVVSAKPKPDDVAAVGLLQEPVRRRLYEWVIAQREPVGRDDAAEGVGSNRALAAFHLDRLTEAGLLKSSYRRLTGRSGPGAGRPARLYARADRDVAVSLPARNYERVAEIFATALEKMAGDTPPEPLRDAAEAAGEGMAASGDADATERRGLIEILEDNGYQPVSQADGVIRLRNCPFDALVEEHRPLVCGTNLALAQGIVHGAHITDYTPVADQRPGYCCVAFVRSDAAS